MYILEVDERGRNNCFLFYKSIYIFECFENGSLMLIDKGNFLGGYNFYKILEIFMI